MVLLHLVHDGLEGIVVVHGEVGEGLAVDGDACLVDGTHQLAVRHAFHAGSGVDTLNPESAEIALLGPSVTVSVGKTFLIGVLCNGPDVLSGEEITAGSLENLLAARPGGD